jgi:cell division protein FtsQ
MRLPHWKLSKKNRARVEHRAVAWPKLTALKLSWARLASFALGFAALLVLAGSLALTLNRPVRSVTVSGVFQRVPALEVERVVREHLHGGFLTERLSELQRAVERLPWVDRALVQRRWPEGLIVHVTEQVAAARWGSGGLLNTRGELFAVDARHIPEELPRLGGPAGSEQQVALLYFQLYPRLLESGLRIAALNLDERGAWELELANGVAVRFGRRQLAERIERFLKTGAAVIAGRPNDIAALDMRYSNGFAVAWRTSAAAAARAPARAPDPQPKERDHDV